MPDLGLNVLFEGRNFVRLLGGLWTALWIALAAMAASVVLGLPMGVLMTSRHRLVKLALRGYLEAIRVLPQLVLLFVFYFDLTYVTGVNLSPELAAFIVFTLWGTAEMGDLVRGAITAIPLHQYQSGYALGLKPSQVQAFVVLPQSVRRLLPLAVNLVTRMVKTTSLIVLIGVTEVLKVGQQIIDRNRFQYPDAALWVYATIFLLYFLACFPISRLAQTLERRFAV
ncbi:MAG: amino acid ABC transporter permease [Propionibacteriaceae bacterium]|nr:amino acid ABC transporter permease [Propionibacteriaceae bacterium]